MISFSFRLPIPQTSSSIVFVIVEKYEHEVELYNQLNKLIEKFSSFSKTINSIYIFLIIIQFDFIFVINVKMRYV